MSRSTKPYDLCYPKTEVFKDKHQVDQTLYSCLSLSGWAHNVRKLTVPKKSGLAWELRAGQTCRVVTAFGAQVGDVNIWNLHNFNEKFYSGKTRQLHRTHLTMYDRLWSTMPYLRPLATITQDSIQYGFDDAGMSVHDVIGTRCDPYTNKLLTGSSSGNTCHQNLTEAIRPWGLKEYDVHDVFNIFMYTGFDRDTHEYICRGSPAKVGDFIEFVAEMDLLVALSACPQGDVSIPCGQIVPDSMCFPLDVYIGQPEDEIIQKWQATTKNE